MWRLKAQPTVTTDRGRCMLKQDRNLLIEAIGITALCGYLFVLLYLTILQRLHSGYVTGMFLENYKIKFQHSLLYSVNIIPFKTIGNYILHAPNKWVLMTNLLGNVLAFCPLGFLAPVVFDSMRTLKKAVILGACTSVLIELLQLVFRIGSTDIDDVILNTIGCLIGYGLVSILLRYRKDKRL